MKCAPLLFIDREESLVDKHTLRFKHSAIQHEISYCLVRCGGRLSE